MQFFNIFFYQGFEFLHVQIPLNYYTAVFKEPFYGPTARLSDFTFRLVTSNLNIALTLLHKKVGKNFFHQIFLRMRIVRRVRRSARIRKLRERQSRDQRVDNRNQSRRRNQDAENNRKYVEINIIITPTLTRSDIAYAGGWSL